MSESSRAIAGETADDVSPWLATAGTGGGTFAGAFDEVAGALDVAIGALDLAIGALDSAIGALGGGLAAGSSSSLSATVSAAAGLPSAHAEEQKVTIFAPRIRATGA